jgi:hypothetical protein
LEFQERWSEAGFETAPSGELLVVSLDQGAIYEISRR